MTRDTVAYDTPASSATSKIVTSCIWLALPRVALLLKGKIPRKFVSAYIHKVVVTYLVLPCQAHLPIHPPSMSQKRIIQYIKLRSTRNSIVKRRYFAL